jgi:hypothetical protein
LQPTSSISIIPVLILFFNLNLYFPRVFFAWYLTANIMCSFLHAEYKDPTLGEEQFFLTFLDCSSH